MPKWISCQKACPKAITWELQNSDKITNTAKTIIASKLECKQQCPQKNVPMNKEIAQILKTRWKRAAVLNLYPLLTAHSKALARKNIVLDWNWCWNFYLRAARAQRFRGRFALCCFWFQRKQCATQLLKGTSMNVFYIPGEMVSKFFTCRVEFPPSGHFALSH